MFQEEREDGVSLARSSPDQAARTFVEVARRVEPIAERFCEEQTAEIADFNCDVQIVLDDQMPYRNVYQTYAGDGTPIVAFTLPMVADARNRDEIAFVLGHEFGHHIARHIQKGQQQATAGALILGTLMAAAQAQSAGSPYYNQAEAQQDLQNVMELGYAAVRRAFSKQYAFVQEKSPGGEGHLVGLLCPELCFPCRHGHPMTSSRLRRTICWS